MCRFVCLTLVLLVQIALINCNDCEPPLKLMFQVVPHFKTVQFCNRICTPKYRISDKGVRHISFKCKLRECETASELCGCVHNYLNQRNWLDGSTSSCCVKGNYVTLKLKGKPDQTNNNQKPKDKSLDQPLEELKGIIDQFAYAELEKHNCRPSSSIDDCGCIHCLFECDLRPDSPCKEKICEGILKYFNQDSWLDRSTSKCTSTKEHLYLEIIGDSIPGNKCVKRFS